MLAPEGHEIANRWIVASFHVRPQKLPTLRESERVDGGGRGQNFVIRKLFAYLLYLKSEVAKEGGSAVTAGIIVEPDVIYESARVG